MRLEDGNTVHDVAQQRLGHTEPSPVPSTYGHATKTGERRMAGTMSALEDAARVSTGRDPQDWPLGRAWHVPCRLGFRFRFDSFRARAPVAQVDRAPVS